ncbi:condensation domain-containing protein [Methylogaea oryzae]|uniref:condensation domain-containing protein n=1 Tax=Methylogaea oryzae TaxID=1295382 RepID=UPI0006D2BD90|nr:condensation domain-containing protein [Methylogaea oryzae]
MEIDPAMAEPIIPDIFPTEPQDELVQAFCEIAAGGYLRLLFDYPQQLDAERLSLAMRRMLDAEPILGCRFEVENGKSRWRRRDDLDAIAHCRVISSVDPEADTHALLVERFDPQTSPNVNAVVIRRQNGTEDRLLLRISHVAADGTAALDFAMALTDMYNQLGKNPDYRLPPNEASRDSFLWLRNFRARDRWRLLWEDLKDLPKALGPKRGLASDAATYLSDAENLRPDYLTLRLDERRVAKIDRYAYDKGVTLNDICLAAFLRAFDEYCPEPLGAPLEVVMPTNLRRYAPLQRRPAIRNQAGSTHIRIGKDVGATFEDTLAKVCRETLRHKQRLLGTEGQMLTRWLAGVAYPRKKNLLQRQILRGLKNPAPPVLTQIGHTRGNRFACDGIAPTDLVVFGESSPSPIFLVTLVRLNDRIGIAACFDQRLGVQRVAHS